MELSRRDFLKAGGAGMGGLVMLGALGSKNGAGASTKAIPLKKQIGEKMTICPYDASGCGFIIATEGDRVVNLEGDPEHPINRGGACSKGAGMAQLNTVDGKLNERRLTKVRYRRPGGTAWEDMSWTDAIKRIARNIKTTRDNNWTEKDDQGYTVNRTDGIANIGGSALDNEECYLLAKMARALGVVYLEHHARI